MSFEVDFDDLGFWEECYDYEDYIMKADDGLEKYKQRVREAIRYIDEEIRRLRYQMMKSDTPLSEGHLLAHTISGLNYAKNKIKELGL